MKATKVTEIDEGIPAWASEKAVRIEQVLLHASPLVPGILGSETNLNQTRTPGIEMWWIDNKVLVCKHKNKVFRIPAGNIVNMVEMVEK